jgi:hypothetical protein
MKMTFSGGGKGGIQWRWQRLTVVVMDYDSYAMMRQRWRLTPAVGGDNSGHQFSV